MPSEAYSEDEFYENYYREERPRKRRLNRNAQIDYDTDYGNTRNDNGQSLPVPDPQYIPSYCIIGPPGKRGSIGAQGRPGISYVQNCVITSVDPLYPLVGTLVQLEALDLRDHKALLVLKVLRVIHTQVYRLLTAILDRLALWAPKAFKDQQDRLAQSG